MDLFAPDPEANLLPRDGTARYLGRLLEPGEADAAFLRLRDGVAWEPDVVRLFGKRIVTARLVAWYGDRDFAYAYSGTERRALPWTEELLGLKRLAESALDARYNSCLLNLYHDGSEGMGWHSDDEATLVEGASIASLSLGAERRFVFRHKRDREQKVAVALEHGSLLEMAGETQRHWSHALPKAMRVKEARINLTFRLMREA